MPPVTKEFFAKVQNKLHFAIHGHTTAEVIYECTRDLDRVFVTSALPPLYKQGVARNEVRAKGSATTEAAVCQWQYGNVRPFNFYCKYSIYWGYTTPHL